MSDTEQTLRLLIDLLKAKVVDFESEPPLTWDADVHEVTWTSHSGTKYLHTLTLTPYDTEGRGALKIRALTDWVREMGTHVRLEKAGIYSNIPSGGNMTREALDSAISYIREQAGTPIFKVPKPIDPVAIRARADAAYPGPWAQEFFHGTVMLPGAIGEPMGHEATREDHVFIGHARTDVPALLDVIDVLARLLLNPGHEIEYEGERVFTYRPGEVIEALAALGLDTVEKRDAARSKLSWSGGGSLGTTDTKPVG